MSNNEIADTAQAIHLQSQKVVPMDLCQAIARAFWNYVEECPADFQEPPKEMDDSVAAALRAFTSGFVQGLGHRSQS
jgi:hypothetical protein